MNGNILEKSAIQCLEEWLDSYLNFERTPKKGIFWLDTIKYLCERFENPQQSYKSVHIAGSKGKGSVSTMLSSIIKEHIGSCGLYTSPHILSLAERITNNQIFFDEKIYEEALKELIYKTESIIPENLPNNREITWFELVTLYGFLCFRKANLSWAVFETGLGGRLDSTNILLPELSVITPIELEHTEFLGNTIQEIAYEKAGIIKNNIPVCVSKQSKEALEIIKTKAQETNSEVFYIEDYVSKIDFKLPKITRNNESKKMKVEISFNKFFNRSIKTELSLIGKIQAENASLAALCAKIIFPEISEETIEKGLSKANLQGRFEIEDNPKNHFSKIIFDGAHTVNSIRGTIDSFSKIFDSQKNILVFGSALDKDVENIAEELIKSDLFSKIFITKPGNVKQTDLEKVKQAFEKKCNTENIQLEVQEDFEAILKKAYEDSSKENKHLLITGSFYLVAEAKKILEAISSK